MARIVLPAIVTFLLLGQVHAVKAAASDAAQGHDDYVALCADCHGVDAKGNGPLTKNLTKIPPDLTRIKQRAKGEFNEKLVFDWILGLNTPNFHGTREMPIWGDWLTDEIQDDDRSLEAAPLAQKEIEARVMAIVKYLEGQQVSP